jgi:hypothetical protein
MRLPDIDALARLLLPMLREGNIERAIELARRIVRDVEQFGLCERGNRTGGQRAGADDYGRRELCKKIERSFHDLTSSSIQGLRT